MAELASSGGRQSTMGFLGLSNGPQAPGGNFSNASLDALNTQNQAYGANSAANAEALDPTQGMNLATSQVESNPILSQLYGGAGSGSSLSNATGQLNSLENQGYSLQPQDQTAYGQAQTSIENQAGNSNNQLAQSLAARGLGSGSSGAAGAMYSGIQGNTNEQLAAAQTNIANLRMQNTTNRIAQQQQFISQLGGQANNAISADRNANTAGVEAQNQSESAGANAQNSANSAQNNYQLQQFNTNQANRPANFADMAEGGLFQATGAGSSQAGKQIGGAAGNSASASMFG